MAILALKIRWGPSGKGDISDITCKNRERERERESNRKKMKRFHLATVTEAVWNAKDSLEFPWVYCENIMK